MRYAILGDIHSNLEALEAALKALRSLRIDQYVQVGDIVGYGADPGPCIQAMRDIHAIVVAGNHDWAVIGKLDTAYFNPYARAAVEWTRTILSQDDRHYLERLPLRRGSTTRSRSFTRRSINPSYSITSRLTSMPRNRST